MRYILVFVFLAIMLPEQLISQNAQYFSNQGKLHYELQEYDEAIAAFEHAIHFPNPSRDLYVYLTSSYLLNDNPQKAVERAGEGIGLFDGFIRLKAMKGEGLVYIDRKEAIRTFKDVFNEIRASGEVELAGVQSETIKKYLSQLYEQEAINAFDQDDLSNAAAYYKKAREFNPENPSIHNNLSYILISQQKFEEAFTAIDFGLQNFPGSENLLLMKAQVLEEQNDHEMMASILEQLYKKDPDNIERAVLYGKSLINSNQAQKANLFFREKIEQFPEERALYRVLIDINRQRFNQSGVLQVLKLKMNQFPDDLEIHEEYGLELITARQYGEAHAFFDSLATKYQNPEYGKFASHAILYNEDYELAEQEYRKQITRWPDHSEMLGEFSLVLIQNSRYSEAREVMGKYLRNNENGRIRIQYAKLTEDVTEREEIVKPLNNTLYEGQANWLLAKDSEIIETEHLKETLNGLTELYNKRKEDVQEEAQFGLSQFRAPNPPLLQIATELDEISEQLQDILIYVQNHFSFTEAVEILETSLNEYPSSALLYHHKGVLFFNNNDLNNAVNNLQRAAELQANNEETHLYLGHIYSAQDEYEQASLFYERVLSISDEHTEAYRSLIRLHQNHEELDTLCNRWLQRYKNENNNQVLKNYLIEVLHRSNRFEEANELINRE